MIDIHFLNFSPLLSFSGFSYCLDKNDFGFTLFLLRFNGLRYNKRVKPPSPDKWGGGGLVRTSRKVNVGAFSRKFHFEFLT